MVRRSSFVAEVSLVGVAAVWGLTFVMVQDAIQLLPVMAFLAFRFLPAALLVSLVFHREVVALAKSGWRYGMVMGIFLTAGYVFQTFGLDHTTASNAGFITGLFVVLTPVFGALFLRRRAAPIAWAAAAVSTVGLFLLSGADGRLNLGDGLVFLSACSFAGHILTTDRAVKNHHTGALLTVQLAFCGVVCFLVAAALGELEIPRSMTVWSALIVTSIFASALGFFIQTYAQRHASPERTALILAAEPAFAGLFAYLLAGERLVGLAWVGAGLILVAIVTVELVPYVRRVRPLPEGTVAEDPHL